jgi:hypothetical protein
MVSKYSTVSLSNPDGAQQGEFELLDWFFIAFVMA